MYHLPCPIPTAVQLGYESVTTKATFPVHDPATENILVVHLRVNG